MAQFSMEIMRLTGSVLRGNQHHSLRRTKAAQIYKKTRNLRAVQILLGHTKLECTVRYLGVEVDVALRIAEQIEL
jgi:site-specific recombinase XerC